MSPPAEMTKSANLKGTDITVNLANPGQTTSLGLGVLQADKKATALQIWNISKGSAVDLHNQTAASNQQIRVGDVILGISNAAKTANNSSELAAQLGDPANFTQKNIQLSVARRENTVNVKLVKNQGQKVYLGMELQDMGKLNNLKLQQIYTGKLSEAMKKDATMAVAVGDSLMSVDEVTDKAEMRAKLSAWTESRVGDPSINLKFKTANRMAGNLSTLSSSMSDVLRQEHDGGLVVYEKATSPLSVIMTICREVAEMTRNKTYLRVLALLFVLLLAMTSSMSGVQMPQLSMPTLSTPLPFLSSSNGEDGNVANLVLSRLLGEPAYDESTSTTIGGMTCGNTQVVLKSTAVGAETLKIEDQDTVRCATGWETKSVSSSLSVEGAQKQLDFTLLSCPKPSTMHSRSCIVSHKHATQTTSRRNGAKRNFATRRVSKKSRRRSRY